MLNMPVCTFNQQDALCEVEHDRVVDYGEDGRVDGFDASHSVVVDFVVPADLRVIVFTLTQDAIVLVFLNFVERDKCIAAFVLYGLRENTIFIVVAERVHQNVGLGRGHMDATSRLFYLTAFDLRVVAFGDLHARAQNRIDLYSLHNLLGSLSLQVDANNLAVGNRAILDLNSVVWVSHAVDRSSFEINELGV